MYQAVALAEEQSREAAREICAMAKGHYPRCQQIAEKFNTLKNPQRK